MKEKNKKDEYHIHKDDKNHILNVEQCEPTIKSLKINHLGPDNSSGRRLGVESGIALTSAMIQSF